MDLDGTVAALQRRVRGLMGQGLVRSVAVLAGGAALSQVLAIAVLPILTRLYSPEDFSAVAVYTSTVAIVAGIACVRMDIAVPLPALDEDAANLLCLALAFSAVVAIAAGMCVLVGGDAFVALVKQPALGGYLWLIPIGIWFTSSYSAVQAWATRRKRFTRVARTRLVQAVGAAAAQVGLGLLRFSVLGLLVGQLVQNGAGFIRLGLDAKRNDRTSLGAVRRSGMVRVLREYGQFAKYSVLDTLANSAGIQIPVMMIASLSIGPDAGHLMLANRVMAAPMALIGSAVSQVYVSHATEKRRSNELSTFTASIIEGLLRTGAGPLLFAGLVAPPAFSILFGPVWHRAGVLVTWMTPWFLLQFLASPISMVMHVQGQHRSLFIVTLAGFAIRMGATLGAHRFAPSFIGESYAVSGGIFYLGCLVVFCKTAGVTLRSSGAFCRHVLTPIGVWLVLGAVIRLVLQWYV